MLARSWKVGVGRLAGRSRGPMQIRFGRPRGAGRVIFLKAPPKSRPHETFMGIRAQFGSGLDRAGGGGRLAARPRVDAPPGGAHIIARARRPAKVSMKRRRPGGGGSGPRAAARRLRSGGGWASNRVIDVSEISESARGFRPLSSLLLVERVRRRSLPRGAHLEGRGTGRVRAAADSGARRGAQSQPAPCARRAQQPRSSRPEAEASQRASERERRLPRARRARGAGTRARRTHEPAARARRREHSRPAAAQHGAESMLTGPPERRGAVLAGE